MAAITQFYMIDEVARMLGEDPEMLEAIVSNAAEAAATRVL